MSTALNSYYHPLFFVQVICFSLLFYLVMFQFIGCPFWKVNPLSLALSHLFFQDVPHSEFLSPVVTQNLHTHPLQQLKKNMQFLETTTLKLDESNWLTFRLQSIICAFGRWLINCRCSPFCPANAYSNLLSFIIRREDPRETHLPSPQGFGDNTPCGAWIY